MKTNRRQFLGTMALSPLFFGTAASIFSGARASENADAQTAEALHPSLPFRDGHFKILQLTDLHLHFTDEEGKGKAASTLEVIRKLLDAEKPDLTILTGDLISVDPTGLTGGVAEAWKKLAEPFEETRTPFAVTFGNHDHERKESAAEQMTMIRTSPLSVNRLGDAALPGSGNDWVALTCADGKERWRLWLFDSHSYPARPNLSNYDWIKSEQIRWYREAAQAAAQEGAVIPALAFFHIPLPEYWRVHHAEGTQGTAQEDVCAPELNSGLFTAFVEEQDVRGVFVGHDHVNDYIGVHKGTALAYGRKTGFDSYGELPRGGLLIELTEGGVGFQTCLVTPEGRTGDYLFPPPEPTEAKPSDQ